MELPVTWPFPGFGTVEMARRRTAFEDLLERRGLEHAVLYGVNRSGSAISWLTQWPVTREAHVLVSRGQPDVLLVNYYNHVPQAIREVPDADVRWAGERPADSVVELLGSRGPGGRPVGRVGLVGALPFTQYAVLSEAREVVDLNADYTRLRLCKSDEELAALRSAAALTDLAVTTVLDEPVIGCTDHELLARMEHAYVSRGGMHHIHYLGLTSMASPTVCVPAQWPTNRRASHGDVMSFEVSAGVAPDYSGQLLRTVAVGAEPTPDVARLHEVAEAAFSAIEARLRPGVHVSDLVAATGVIEDAGFTTVDDLVHGFGGGYLPPVLGSASRAIRPVPDIVLEAGMTLVVQPNVTTLDHRMGVQTGELLVVTEHGAERLHGVPRGLLRAT